MSHILPTSVLYPSFYRIPLLHTYVPILLHTDTPYFNAVSILLYGLPTSYRYPLLQCCIHPTIESPYFIQMSHRYSLLQCCIHPSIESPYFIQMSQSYYTLIPPTSVLYPSYYRGPYFIQIPPTSVLYPCYYRGPLLHTIPNSTTYRYPQYCCIQFY